MIESSAVCVSLKLDAAQHAAFECNSVCVPAQRASHKSAQGNALGLGMSGTKSPNGADLNRFELVTAKISAAPLGLEIIAWKISQGVALG